MTDEHAPEAIGVGKLPSFLLQSKRDLRSYLVVEVFLAIAVLASILIVPQLLLASVVLTFLLVVILSVIGTKSMPSDWDVDIEESYLAWLQQANLRRNFQGVIRERGLERLGFLGLNWPLAITLAGVILLLFSWPIGLTVSLCSLAAATSIRIVYHARLLGYVNQFERAVLQIQIQQRKQVQA